MRNLILILVVIAGGAELWKRYGSQLSNSLSTPLTASSSDDAARAENLRPRLIVYGRNSCGLTTQMRKSLAQRGITFEYRIVDNAAVADELHSHMESQGMATQRYNLPVVEIHGNLYQRPTPGGVINDYAN